MLEVYRAFEIKGAGSAITALIDELTRALPLGWSRNQFIENERADPTIYVFVLPESSKHPVAQVCLVRGEDGLCIGSIHDLHRESLQRTEHNAAAEEFSSACSPIADRLGLKVSLTPDRYDIASDLNSEAMSTLGKFSPRMSTSQGSERQGFLEFIVRTHRDASSLSQQNLTRWLVEIEKWPEDRARRTTSEYGFGRELLRCFESMSSK